MVAPKIREIEVEKDPNIPNHKVATMEYEDKTKTMTEKKPNKLRNAKWHCYPGTSTTR